MDSIYSCYICKRCRKEIVLLTDEVNETKEKGNYIVCSKNIKLTSKTDSIKECMEHAAYKRDHGAIRQVRQK